jgi:hypothetical protein
LIDIITVAAIKIKSEKKTVVNEIICDMNLSRLYKSHERKTFITMTPPAPNKIPKTSDLSPKKSIPRYASKWTTKRCSVVLRAL